jgi:hypothetical protein
MIEVKQDGKEFSVLVNGNEIQILDAESNNVLAECELDDLAAEVTTEFPPNLTIQVHSEDSFGTSFFHELEMSRHQDGVELDFIFHLPNKIWEGHFGLAATVEAISKQVPLHEGLSVQEMELEDDWKRLVVGINVGPGQNLTKAITDAANELKQVITEADIALGGLIWKAEYETDEALFCTEVLTPLLRKMGFIQVRYRHGNMEFGKDFTFSEMTQFGLLRHYGLQAKAGNISGGVNAEIDELIGQVNDAFSIPYCEIGSKEQRYISVFIIAISGRFTANAKEKIAEKIPKGAIGSVCFLDEESILELVERYWQAK